MTNNSSISVTVQFEAESLKAFRALMTAARILGETAESQQWNAELQRAARCLRYAAKHIKTNVRD